MRWFSLLSLRALVKEIESRENRNMQAVNNTFNEVYENLETLDKKVDGMAFTSTAAYLGNCFCGSAYLGGVSETDT